MIKHFLLLIACSIPCFGATLIANSAALTDVQSKVNSAARGDTVLVPDGTVSWAGSLSLTKGVRVLPQNGFGFVQINRNTTMVTINPDATAIANEEVIQVGSFIFDGQNAAAQNGDAFIEIGGASATSTKPYKSLIISSNRFQNGGTGNGNLSAVIKSDGQVRGVIAKNDFNRCNVIATIMGNDDTRDWENTNYNQLQYGTVDNLYFENNTIRYSSSYTGNNPGWIETGQGGRFCGRYNTWAFANATTPQEIWDIHGTQNWAGSPGSGQTSTMLIEYYGNAIIGSGCYRWINHRGSWGLYHNNVLTGSGGNSIDLYGVTSPNRCDVNIVPSPAGRYTAQVNNTYFINNSDDGNISSGSINIASCGVSENVSFFNYNAAFNGSSGIGRGAAAPSANPTTAGVAYWQASTPTPTTNSAVLQAGILWKGGSGNWTNYYTPFTYPHPLLADSGSGGGVVITNRITISNVTAQGAVSFNP